MFSTFLSKGKSMLSNTKEKPQTNNLEFDYESGEDDDLI